MPTKATYLLLDRNPETEFEFFLATKLGMTVARLREEMSQREFVAWSIYYQRLAQLQEMAQAQGGE